MNINTHASPAHRHALAAPLLLLLVTISLSSSLKGQADLFTGSDSEKTFTFRGMVGMQQEGSSIHKEDVLTLEEGSLLLASEGRIQLNLSADTKLLALTGGFFATKHGNSITVVALTTPVLLRSPQGLLLIPQGMQWRGETADLVPFSDGVEAWSKSRTFQEIPADFYEEQLKTLRDMEEAVDSAALLPPVSASLPRRTDQAVFLQFPAAAARAQNSFAQTYIGWIRFLIEKGSTAEAENLLSAEGKEVLAEQEVRAYIPALLSKASSVSTLPTLFAALASDEDLMTVAAIHPRYRVAFWMSEQFGATSKEATLLQLLLLPVSDRFSEALPSFVVQQWNDDVKNLLHATEEPVSLLTVVMETVLHVTHDAERRDQPERALSYEQALKAIVAPYESLLTPKQKTMLRERIKKEPIREPIPVPSEKVSEAALPPPEEKKEGGAPPWKFSVEETLAEAHNLLLDAGAIFSIQTSLTAEKPPVVHVKDIVFPGTHGDATFSLLLNVQNGEVMDIEEQGKMLPFALPLKNFAPWAKEQ